MAITSSIYTNEVTLRFDMAGLLIGMQYKEIQIVKDKETVYSAVEQGPFNVDITISENVAKVLGDALIAANERIATLNDEIGRLSENADQVDLSQQ